MSQIVQTAPRMEAGTIHTSVVSQSPGRIRFRVAQPHLHGEKIERIANTLQERLDIYKVRTNVQSGSITVFHAEEHSHFEDVYAILRDLGVIFIDVTGKTEIPLPGKSEAATGITNAVFDLNKRVGAATNGIVDLRFLVPLGFSALAVRQLMIKGLQLDFIPWYVLAWYAFDSFIKLHYTSEPQAKNG
ncbi:MAG TPA: hypothetical protein DDZ80_22595 [Cyanobacteria bacterium UBA8803]|nr:hypothetical protein [Cyanobacteria bacterium UBA9273]HBL61116.1 hypothetical protein [Cyanobacteria bacterium UBA8803]